jgi:hypothetical protein
MSFSMTNLYTLLWMESEWLISAVLPAVVVELTNEARTEDGLGTLTRNSLLDKAARLKAMDMASRGYFAHDAPDGTTPWHWFGEVGYEFVRAGENLAVHFTDSGRVVEAWMQSPGHRANILGDNYTEIGIGTARGTYEGYEAVFVVQLFGTPVPSAVQPRAGGDREVVSSPAPSPAPVAQRDQDVAHVPDQSGGDVAVQAASFGEDVHDAAPRSGAAPHAVTSDVEASVDTPATLAAVATRPNMLLQIVYAILAGFVTIVLIASVIIEWRRQRPVQIAYGVGLLALIGVLFSVQAFVSGGVLVV